MRGSKKSRPTLQDDYPQARASQNPGMEFFDWIDGELVRVPKVLQTVGQLVEFGSGGRKIVAAFAIRRC